MFAFRLYILAVACVAAGSFQLTAELCERAVGRSKKRDDEAPSALRIIVNYDDSGDRSSKLPLYVFWQQVWHQKNVWTYGLINFIQVCRSACSE